MSNYLPSPLINKKRHLDLLNKDTIPNTGKRRVNKSMPKGLLGEIMPQVGTSHKNATPHKPSLLNSTVYNDISAQPFMKNIDAELMRKKGFNVEDTTWFKMHLLLTADAPRKHQVNRSTGRPQQAHLLKQNQDYMDYLNSSSISKDNLGGPYGAQQSGTTNLIDQYMSRRKKKAFIFGHQQYQQQENDYKSSFYGKTPEQVLSYSKLFDNDRKMGQRQLLFRDHQQRGVAKAEKITMKNYFLVNKHGSYKAKSVGFETEGYRPKKL